MDAISDKEEKLAPGTSVGGGEERWELWAMSEEAGLSGEVAGGATSKQEVCLSRKKRGTAAAGESRGSTGRTEGRKCIAAVGRQGWISSSTWFMIAHGWEEAGTMEVSETTGQRGY